MKSRWQPGCDLYFVIQEEHKGHSAKQAFITSDIIDTMIRKGKFEMSHINVELSDKITDTEILLCIGAEGKNPISRFPRSLLQDEDPKQS